MAAPIGMRTDEELSDFYTKLEKGIFLNEKDTQLLENLREMFLIQLSIYESDTRLPESLVCALCHMIDSGVEDFSNIEVMCCAILKEISPNKHIEFSAVSTPGHHTKKILPVLACQDSHDASLKSTISSVIKWISTVGIDNDTQLSSLVFISVIASLHGALLNAEQCHVVLSQICDWLQGASLYQASNPTSRSKLFKKDEISVTEIDGVSATGSFTALNLGKFFSGDQILNIYSFSFLRNWLSLYKTRDEQSTQTKQLLAPVQDYCYRLIEQCDRKAKVQCDSELQESVLLEAVSILDQTCLLDKTLVPKTFEFIKRLFTKVSEDSSKPSVVLTVLQFILNHSTSMENLCCFFSSILNSCYMDPHISFETVAFLLRNLEILCYKTDILTKFFPNIFKILAWNPRNYVHEFLDIVPAVLNNATTVEVLHLLLDLPCMAAAMETSLSADVERDTPQSQSILLRRQKSVEAYKSSIHGPLFNFILRQESGHGDTISRLDVLHNVLQDVSENPRVVLCAQIVPVMLKCFFATISDVEDESLANQLIPVMIERSLLLFSVSSTFLGDVQRILSDQLLILFKRYPSLIIDQQVELFELISTPRHVDGREQFFIHVVWAIGEYCAIQYDQRCNHQIISKYYESLECLIYEISGLIQNTLSNEKIPYSIQLLCTLISSLAKLSSRCQDLLPRALLCLTKISQQHISGVLDENSKQTLTQRASELINLLKLPNVAAMILTPSEDLELGTLHKDCNATPVLLQFTSNMLKKIY